MTRPAPDSERADQWISRAATATVAGLAGIAGAISYSHMRQLAAAQGDTGWHAHAFPLSVDGVEIVASLVLLADRRSGRKSGWLPWAALTIGTAASVATAHAGAISRIIAGWPAVALLIAVKLLSGILEHRAVGDLDSSPTAATDWNRSPGPCGTNWTGTAGRSPATPSPPDCAPRATRSATRASPRSWPPCGHAQRRRPSRRAPQGAESAARPAARDFGRHGRPGLPYGAHDAKVTSPRGCAICRPSGCRTYTYTVGFLSESTVQV